MRKLSQLQYEVIFLYSKGLTFKEIDKALNTASRGVYSQVLEKDKGRVTRAKKSRLINQRNYKEDLKIYIAKVKEHNKYYKNQSQWVKDRCIINIDVAKNSFRNKYIKEMSDKAYQSYMRYKLTFLKNHIEKVA